jgi:methylated-DNA-[protein]-cysteine S-methyltransferase
MTVRLDYAYFESPFGWVGLARSDQGISRIVFGATTRETAINRLFEANGCRGEDCTPVDSRFSDAVVQLTRYFEGEPVDFCLPLDLQAGTAFQQTAWRAARSIPYGEVRSYGWLAREIGRPGAARAVGGAMGANPLLIIVPCHRVLCSDGGPGGYSGGLEWKSRLLSLEAQGRSGSRKASGSWQ